MIIKNIAPHLVLKWGAIIFLVSCGVAFAVFLVAVLTAVDFLDFVREIENLRKLLLNGGDASWIVTFDYSGDFFRENQSPFFNDHAVLDNIDGDVMVDIGQYIQIKRVDVTFYLEDIFFAHGLTLGVLDDGYCGVELIKSKMVIYLHAFSGLDMVKNKAFFYFSNI
jgi:hypothetical protein